VAIDQPGKDCLAAAVVDIGILILLQNSIGRSDRRDRRSVNGQGHVVLRAVDGDDGGMGEDDRPCRLRTGRCLRFDAAVLQEERSCAGAGAGEQLTTGEVKGFAHASSSLVLGMSRRL
jgi:hypothetical protein